MIEPKDGGKVVTDEGKDGQSISKWNNEFEVRKVDSNIQLVNVAVNIWVLSGDKEGHDVDRELPAPDTREDIGATEYSYYAISG